jgi:GxxExxY protein
VASPRPALSEDEGGDAGEKETEWKTRKGCLLDGANLHNVGIDGRTRKRERDVFDSGSLFRSVSRKRLRIYEECLQIELRLQGVPFTRQQAIHLEYKSNPLKCSYVPDFVCFEGIILEVKAVSALSDEHRAQVQNYLRATGYEVGMLANFGHFPKMQIERFVGGKGRYRTSPSFRGPSGEAGL